MSTNQISALNESSSDDSDKYQLALDAVIHQMNLLSNDLANENLRLAHEQARQRFIEISNMEKDEYEKFIHTKLPTKSSSQNRINHVNEYRIQHIEQSWLHSPRNIYILYVVLMVFFLSLTTICILIALK